MIFTKGGELFRVVVGLNGTVFLARWKDDRNTGGHWAIIV